MEAIESNLNEILLSTKDNIPAEQWENFSINICALNKMISIKAFYEIDGKFISFDPEENGNDITMKIKKLREDMYSTSPQKGAWYSAMFTVTNKGNFNSFFDYDNKPEFKYEPSKDKFVDDLNKFPREKELIPSWLTEIVDS